jgi:starch-binding outer membrane protein, SusD/RagB family
MPSPTRLRAPALGASACLAVFLLAGCGDITSLTQSNPGSIDAADVYQPANAQLLLNGMLSDFECSYSRVVTSSGLLSDELEAAIAQSLNFDFDRRRLLPNHPYSAGCGTAQYPGVYTSLSRARGSADTTYARMSEWTVEQVPDRERMLGQLAAYGGYTLTLMGENMCSAAIDVGPEGTPAQLFAAAEERFNRAITAATTANRTDLLNAALAGRARVRLYQNNPTGAAADAQLVPAGFVFNATAANDPNGRRWNRIFHFVNFSRFHMVAAESRNLTTGGVADPRTASVTTTTRALDGRFSVQQTKYADLTSSMPITRYEEAQLILAEAQGGATAINIINGLRARHNLPAMSAAEQSDIQGTLIEERRRELWLEGQRFYDINRFQSRIALTPPTGTAFLKGGSYGPTRCLPLPDVERFNNPCIRDGQCS